MAGYAFMRDTAQSGRDGKEPLLNRRQYVTAAGGAVAAVLGIGPAAAGSNRGAGSNSVTVSTTDETSSSGDSTTAATDSEGPAVGGGESYGETIAPSEATVVVETRAALNQALQAAQQGDVVYLAGGADIEMGRSEFSIPSGVTLASNRGIDGAPGGRLSTDAHPWGMLIANEDVRISGLRVGGPRWEWIGNVDGELGIDVAGANVEIDNCEVYGWGYAAIRTEDDTHVHHCEIHHNPKDGTGYGVSTGSSTNPIIEYNVFHHNRHSVASSSNGYTARYNYVGKGAISHVFDQHTPGGSTIKIHHNTVAVVDHSTKDKNAPAVAIRGTPSDVADIHHNWFYNPKEPRSNPSGWTDEAIIQVHVDEWENVDYHNNHYGSDDPGTDIGHPR